MSFDVRPLSPVLGAEIVGLDLAEPVDAAAFRRVREALEAHGVVVFRDQARLTPARHVEFSRAFGPLQIHVRAEFLHPEHPEILVVSNVVENGRNVGLADAGRYWHSDLSYVAEPSLGSLLHAREIPAEGGDTLFASTTAAYEALDEGTRAVVDGLAAVHDYDARNREQAALGLRTGLSAAQRQAVPPVVHPVVRVHPATGRRALFVNEGFTTRIVGLPEEEGAALLARLFEHQRRPDFVYRHVWRPHDLVFWDNRSTLHLAAGCPPHLRRHMFRTTVEGDRPVGPGGLVGGGLIESPGIYPTLAPDVPTTSFG